MLGELPYFGDLTQTDGPLRLQVKQSAARQSRHGDHSPPPRPRYAIAHKTGRYDGPTWIAGRSRNADLFIFAWYPVADASADHRDPGQWQFHCVPETALPALASISLAAIARLAPAVSFAELRQAVSRQAALR